MNMQNDVHVGLDIGGTLAKLAIVAPICLLNRVTYEFPGALMIHEKFSADEHHITPYELGFTSSNPQADLDFALFCFNSRNISSLIDFLRSIFASSASGPAIVTVTGGGAVKFRSELESSFPNVVFKKVDEIEAISIGFSFLVRRPDSAFIFQSASNPRRSVPLLEVADPFPLLLVNVGSGVSMLKIYGPGKYQRVQGSPIGGGTVLGLGRALFGATSFDEIMELSMQGDSSSVDLSVGELIGASPGDEYWNFNTLASSLTKLNTSDLAKTSRADLAQSIVRMVSYNIGNIAYLASCLHHCSRIYFSGKYVNKHIPTMESISYAVKFYENWKPPPMAECNQSRKVQLSNKTNTDQCRESHCEVRFMYHEGYVGAIGALIAS